MTPFQGFLTAPIQILGWLWATAGQGWKAGLASAEKLPSLVIPRQLTRQVHPSKIEAIKALRTVVAGLGLKEAKNIFDDIEKGKPYILPFQVSDADVQRLKNIFEVQGQ
jgi:ribosomal protein L7/L12